MAFKIKALFIVGIFFCYLPAAYAQTSGEYLTRGNEALTRALEVQISFHDPQGSENYQLRQKGLEEALGAFNKALALDPGLAAAYHGRGSVQYQQGHSKEGLVDLDRAIALDPTLSKAYYDRAKLHFDRHRTLFDPAAYENAKEDLRKAEELGFPTEEFFVRAVREAEQEIERAKARKAARR